VNRQFAKLAFPRDRPRRRDKLRSSINAGCAPAVVIAENSAPVPRQPRSGRGTIGELLEAVRELTST
jgi:hypothetical protein